MNKLKEKFGQDLKENVPLAPYTTFKIGGPAKYFLEVEDNDELLKAVKAAEEEKILYFILAGGSNVLVADQGFDGLVIKINSGKFKIKNNNIIAEAGANFNKLVTEAAKTGLSGLEWLAGIYGTIGGAVRGNAGAYGYSISSLVEEVKVFQNGKLQKLKNKDCQFGYRESIFKHKQEIVLSVKLKLKKGDKRKIEKVIKECLAHRKTRIPSEPNAGSIFKNIPLNQLDKKRTMKALDISEDEYKFLTRLGDFPTGYIIEVLGYKGKIIGGAQVSEKHANFIVNLGQAKATDVIMLISMIKQKVRNKLGIQLQEEIQLIGF